MDEVIKIDLNSKTSSVIKTGLLLKALLVLTITTMVFWGLWHFAERSWIAFGILLFIGIFSFRIGFKMLDSIFFKEYILIAPGSLTVGLKTLSSHKKQEFALSDITWLGFSSQEYTRHQMDNPVVDFTGLGVGERELQYVIDEGNISLVAGDKAIKFGKNMPSWDVEELLDRIREHTGLSFEQQREAGEETELG